MECTKCEGKGWYIYYASLERAAMIGCRECNGTGKQTKDTKS
jgi:DnaJ-class molecular chaperone